MLEGELALIFDEVGASQTALRAAEHGDQTLHTKLAGGLVGLEHRFDKVSVALAEAHVKLDRIHRDLDSLLELAQQPLIDASHRTDNTLNAGQVDGVVSQVGTVHGDITVGAATPSRPAPPEPVGTPLDQVHDPFALEVHHPVELDHPPRPRGRRWGRGCSPGRAGGWLGWVCVGGRRGR